MKVEGTRKLEFDLEGAHFFFSSVQKCLRRFNSSTDKRLLLNTYSANYY